MAETAARLSPCSHALFCPITLNSLTARQWLYQTRHRLKLRQGQGDIIPTPCAAQSPPASRIRSAPDAREGEKVLPLFSYIASCSKRHLLPLPPLAAPFIHLWATLLVLLGDVFVASS